MVSTMTNSKDVDDDEDDSIMVYKVSLLMWQINMFVYGAMPMS